jgi:hypothetical protein
MSRKTLCGLLVAGLAVSWAGAGGEIHGTIHAVNDRTYTGPIRWDKNEAFWDGTLDAHKTEVVGEVDGGFKLSIFGWKLGGGPETRTVGSLAIPFGHLRAVHRLPDGKALLELKNGHQFEVRCTSSSDLGSGLRELIVEDAERGPVELTWNSLLEVDFSQGPGRGKDAERLYGTVVVGAVSLTGFIVWDRDETLAGDILDGEEDGRDHEVPFGEIASIERVSGGARVVLKDGGEMVLRGSNDVDRGHRGIGVFLHHLGSAKVDWKNVTRVTFSEPPPSRKYADYDGGRRLRGTVRSTTGGVHAGEIVWDRDETFTWESLDGEAQAVEYAVQFENVRSVTPRGPGSAEVRLTDDRVLVLSGTNDVSDSNRGVIVRRKQGAETIEVTLDWGEIDTVEFDQPDADPAE